MTADRAIAIASIVLNIATGVLTVMCAKYAPELAEWGARHRNRGAGVGTTTNYTINVVGSVVVAVANDATVPTPHLPLTGWQRVRQWLRDAVGKALDSLSKALDKLDTTGMIVAALVLWAILSAAGVLFLSRERPVVLAIAYLAVSLSALALVTMLIGVRRGVGLRWNTANILVIAVVCAVAVSLLPHLLVSPVGVHGRFHDPARDLLPHLGLMDQVQHLKDVYGLDIVVHLVFQALGCVLVLGLLVSILPRAVCALRDVVVAARGHPLPLVHGLSVRQILARCGILLFGLLFASGSATGGFLWLSHRQPIVPSLHTGGVTPYGPDLAGIGLVATEPSNYALVLTYCRSERLLRVSETLRGKESVVFSSTVGWRPPIVSLKPAKIDATSQVAFEVTSTHHNPERIVFSQSPPPGSVATTNGIEPLTVFRTSTSIC